MPIRGVGILGNPIPDNNHEETNMTQFDAAMRKKQCIRDHLILVCTLLRNDSRRGMDTLYWEARICKLVDELDQVSLEGLDITIESLGVKQ